NPLFKHSSTRFNIFLFSLMICFLAKLRKMMGLGKMELAGGILSKNGLYIYLSEENEDCYNLLGFSKVKLYHDFIH
ncbi:MAG: hypothetical protein M3Q58_02910, partial [Bacteroidota bacterium]|nr:hypothetical protein [Bacteroidota bacterium]